MRLFYFNKRCYLGIYMLLNLVAADRDKYIYRIISIERLLELFHSEKNTLVNPKKWEDSFENFILGSRVKNSSGEIFEYDFGKYMYGQCWTLHESSDAMWRIYSPNKAAVRIRTTIGALINSICNANVVHQQFTCCIGKVQYCDEVELFDIANEIFDDSGISVDNVFRSLLLKRNAFVHENEIRLLYQSLDNEAGDLYRYAVDPSGLISEITIDPRKTDAEFEMTKFIIEKSINYKGIINKSDLYNAPKIGFLGVTNKSQY